MGTIKIFKETFPLLVMDAISSYFSPLSLAYTFVKDLLHGDSPSEMVLKYEFKKLKSSIEGQRWVELAGDFDSFAENTNQRAALREARINWIISGHNFEHEWFLKNISKESRSINKIIHTVYMDSIADVEMELKKSKKELTYNIIIIDESHESIARSNIESYENLINSINVLPVFTAVPLIKELNISDDYISLLDNTSKSGLVIATKAVELKLQEFMSKLKWLTRESTGR